MEYTQDRTQSIKHGLNYYTQPHLVQVGLLSGSVLRALRFHPLMGSSPPVCSFTASLIQVAYVESRCATIIYMNGIENFLLRGGEKKTRENEKRAREMDI